MLPVIAEVKTGHEGKPGGKFEAVCVRPKQGQALASMGQLGAKNKQL
jgi:hypothetical protein